MKYSISLMMCLVAFISNASADGAPAQAAAQGQPSLSAMLVPFGVMFLIMYFLVIRPQQKKLKDQQSMLQALKAGDEVVTQSGIAGVITDLAEPFTTLEIDRGVHLRVLKSQISQKIKKNEKAEA